MYNSRITIGTTNFDLVSQMPYRSMRSNAARSINEPQTLTVSHETAKSGLRSSVIILEDVKVLNTQTSAIKDSIKAQFKIQFKPYSGRTDIEVTIGELISALSAFVADPDNVDKLLNQES
jgi:hypothetical protein